MLNLLLNLHGLTNMTMKYHCILLDLGHGYTDDKGQYDHGHVTGKLTEVDVIDGYGRALMDELDLEAVRFELVPTRKAPGTKEKLRYSEPPDGKLIVSLHAGVAGPADMIHSKVRYSIPAGNDIAKTLERVCGDWGKSHEKWFASGGAIHDASLPQDKLVLVIEPMTINSVRSFDLSAHLDDLGMRLGRALGSWMKSQNPKHTGFRPAQLIEKEWIPK